MATILSGVLAEEVAKELLEEVPLLEILPVILYDADELLLVVSVVDVESVVGVEEALSFLAHEIIVRLKNDNKIMFNIFFTINLLFNIKDYLNRRIFKIFKSY